MHFHYTPFDYNNSLAYSQAYAGIQMRTRNMHDGKHKAAVFNIYTFNWLGRLLYYRQN
ncbi:MAG: hypothetical protein BroJett021_42880 [Chloroflexota bacterium]|nr:MAG: hypothetical protein BroJett021_42880 [Chloroflexota bacterium]